MYTVDGADRVIELTDIPPSSGGAPLPLVVAGKSTTCVAFYVQDSQPASLEDSPDEPWAIVAFGGCYAHMFGPPNDEAFHGHPLYERGLMPYGAYVVEHSSWLRRLERMNAVHRRHDRDAFMKYKHHMILAFHDETFECIASGYTITVGAGPLIDTIPLMKDLLDDSRRITVPQYPVAEPAPVEPKRAWWSFLRR